MARLTPEELVRRLRRTPSVETPPDLATARRALEEGGAKAPLRPGTTVTGVNVGGVRGEWVVADDTDPSVAVLYVHGGGYTMGSCGTHRALAAHISAAARARVLTVDYRLAPEDPFPAGLNDLVRAWNWLLDQPECDAVRSVIAGDSAGGGLAAATVLALKQRSRPLPAGLVCLSPWADLTGRKASAEALSYDDPLIDLDLLGEWAAAYVGDADARDPLISPVYGDWTGAPPLFVQVGEERLIDDARALAQAAHAAGVDVTLEVWPAMVHVWHFYCGMLDASDEAVAAVGRFVRRCTAREASTAP